MKKTIFVGLIVAMLAVAASLAAQASPTVSLLLSGTQILLATTDGLSQPTHRSDGCWVVQDTDTNQPRFAGLCGSPTAPTVIQFTGDLPAGVTWATVNSVPLGGYSLVGGQIVATNATVDDDASPR